MRWHSEGKSFLPTSYAGYPIPTREGWGLPCDPVPVADDTVACALQSVQARFPDASYPVPGRDIVWATDLMVLSVKAGQITQRMGQVGDFTFGVPQNVPANQMTPKYHTANGLMDPTAQLDLTTWIPAYNEATKTWNYCENGYCGAGSGRGPMQQSEWCRSKD